MQSHIKLDADSRFARAIVCGSPERAKHFASRLQNSQLIAQNREYHSYLGEHKGQTILITSHGVGSAGAAICFQELMNVGVKRIIRIGTAGGLYDELQVGDIVLPWAAARKDGVSRLMVPEGFPAVADLDLVNSLRLGLRENNWRGREGVIITSDLFYPGLVNDELELYQRAGAVAVEMECSTLFVIASLRKVQAGALVVCDGNPLKWSEGLYDPSPERLAQSLETCLQVSLNALIS